MSIIPYGTFFSRPRSGNNDTAKMACAQILDRLARFSIVPHPSSRLPRYLRLTQGLSKSGDAASARLAQAMAADLDEWDSITRRLPLESKYWADKIRDAVNGAASLEPHSSELARNTQFELFFAAEMKRAGFSPRQPSRGSPATGQVDFEFVIKNYSMSVEAKRVTSLNAIPKRLKEAERQLVQSRSAGIIAIDVSRALQRLDRIQFIEPEAILELYSTSKDTVYEYVNQFARQLDSNFAMGIVAYCRHCYVTGTTRKPIQICGWYPVSTISKQDRRYWLMIDLQARLCTRNMESAGFPFYSQGTP